MLISCGGKMFIIELTISDNENDVGDDEVTSSSLAEARQRECGDGPWTSEGLGTGIVCTGGIIG